MNDFFKIFLACLVAIISHTVLCVLVGIFIISGIVASFAKEDTYTVKSKSILKIELAMNMPDRASSNPIDKFDYSTMKFKSTITLFEAISLIEAAAEDPRIDGIYIDIPLTGSPISISSMYELRQAIDKFQEKSNKFVIAYGDNISQKEYYLASGADRIYLNPQGGMDWSGMSSSIMFYKDMFTKLGIEPEIIRHGKFKGAVEPYMLNKMSEENRTQVESYLNSIWNYMVGEIGQSRSIDTDLLQQYASEMTILNAKAAVDAKMVDSLFYIDQMLVELSRLTTTEGDPNFISLAQYRTANPSVAHGNLTSKDQIAVVYAQGNIVDKGDNAKDIVGSNFAEELRKARKNNNIKAVVLRVNSPGGSVMASDAIWREVELLREIKPVVVSMGSYAASGGYYISCPAEEIVANPMTLTGSIGVFGMMFNVEKGAREKLGINVEVVKTNPMADMGNVFRKMTDRERSIIQNGVDSIYTRFVGIVSNGRKMSYEDIDAIGQGRVWTGLQAVENKLVDKTGSLSDAIAIAAQRADIEDYRIKSYPESDDSLNAIFSSIGGMAAQYVKKSLNLIPSVDEIKETVEKHQGVWMKIPYQMELK